MAKPALGRGLGALLGAIPPVQTLAAPPALPAPAALPPGERIERIPLDRLRPCPFQPRKDFPEEALKELADSIREQGIVQPLIVRRRGEFLELIAGERRWRAAQLAGLTDVPVLVREVDDAGALELALIENLQRENLNPIEEAQGYQELLDLFGLRQEDVAVKVGKSRVAVANALRLLKLPAVVQAYLRNGQISTGHAKAILGLPGSREQELAAERAIKQGLNVRDTEALVARWPGSGGVAAGGGAARSTAVAVPDAHRAALEARLQERFGTKVRLSYRRGKGSVEIHYFSDADLERILEILGVDLG
jgi:ParB family chromosome partitioning protein